MSTVLLSLAWGGSPSGLIQGELTNTLSVSKLHPTPTAMKGTFPQRSEWNKIKSSAPPPTVQGSSLGDTARTPTVFGRQCTVCHSTVRPGPLGYCTISRAPFPPTSLPSGESDSRPTRLGFYLQKTVRKFPCLLRQRAAAAFSVTFMPFMGYNMPTQDTFEDLPQFLVALGHLFQACSSRLVSYKNTPKTM